MDSCPNCGHPPIRHLHEGRVWTCLVCLLAFREGWQKTVCSQAMNFRLSQTEREQAAKADRESYPPRILCAECFFNWEQHMGYLCPSGDSTFLPLLTAGDNYKEN